MRHTHTDIRAPATVQPSTSEGDVLAVCVRPKVLEVLSHVNKRVKGVTTLHLPLPELLALFSEPAQAPLVRNFALVYTETAFERAEPSERLTVVSHPPPPPTRCHAGSGLSPV